MRSVQTWAAANQWNYEFLDDRFLSLAPQWVRQHCAGNLYAITDVCRLQWMRNALDAGYERVIWADADILVFEASLVNVQTVRGHAFAHELFLCLSPDGGVTLIEGLNNSLMVFEKQQEVLDVYLAKCLARLRSLPPGAVPRTALGPTLLRELRSEHPLHPLHGIGLFTLAVMREIANGGGRLIPELLRSSPARLGAANLCHFLRNLTPVADRARFDLLYEAAVQRLLRSPLDR
ncbi:MAG: hypothetical protein ACYDHY_12975 [Acidiferrobacterales bacterium]